MKQVLIFLLFLLIWVLLAWPFESDTWQVRWSEVIAGLIVALVASLVMGDRWDDHDLRALNPVRWLWLAAYSAVLVYYIVKANFDVAYRVLHPAMPIRPGIVKIRTGLKTAAAIAALANSITLTPGTLTVSASEDGVLYVHWINVLSSNCEEATKHIATRFEWFIKKIFE